MAHPLPPGLTPSEVGFLCEMEMVTVIPRQRLEELDLLGGRTPALRPPQRAMLPLWLALQLKRQQRANIVPPPWLAPSALESILQREIELSERALSSAAPTGEQSSRRAGDRATPPFVLSATADASAESLPYHWSEIAELLLDAASDDVTEPNVVRSLMQSLRAVRMAKITAAIAAVSPDRPMTLTGAGGLEVAECRAIITAAVDELRKIRPAQEEARRGQTTGENDDDEADEGDDDTDDEMGG